MVTISVIVTAAGRNSRMEKDQIQKNIPVKNKLLLPLNGKNIIETTLSNVLLDDINSCTIVLGHFANEIEKNISNIHNKKIKIIKNNPVDVGLSKSLFNGLINSKSDLVLCVAGDQPSISQITYKNIIKGILESKNPKKTISILRRRKTGILNSVEGLGMPFVSNRKELIKYLKDENDNLNPILGKMFNDGFNFIGIKENSKYELVNVNNCEDYDLILSSL